MTKNQIYELFPIGPEIRDSRLFDPVTAIMGGVGMAGNLVSGIMGNSAAKKAADVQARANTAAADEVTRVTAETNPQIKAAADRAGERAINTATDAGGKVINAGVDASGRVTNDTRDANALLDPYALTGGDATKLLREGIAPGGQFNATPTMKDIQIDPGYAWRVQQGSIGQDRSSAARGGVVSGEAIKDLENYRQGKASEEYAKAFQRFQDNRQKNFDNIFSVAGRGQQAVTTQGDRTIAGGKYFGDTTVGTHEFASGLDFDASKFAGTGDMNAANLMAHNTIDTAKAAADLRTGAAAAKAGGIVGGTNAMTAGIGGAINSGMSAVALNNLLKNPAVRTKNAGSTFIPGVSS